MVLEKILESALDCTEIKPDHPKGNHSWIFIGRTDAEAETAILWPLDDNWLIGKDPDGKDWRQEDKGMTEDEMVGWHHRFNGHEFEQAPGVGDGQGSLVCCSPWGRRVERTARLNWTVAWGCWLCLPGFAITLSSHTLAISSFIISLPSFSSWDIHLLLLLTVKEGDPKIKEVQNDLSLLMSQI